MIGKKETKHYFTTFEILLWVGSAVLILVSFCIFDKENYLTLLASLIGVTSLIFNAKGNPFGQFLMVLFSLLYGVISYSFSYYGEMLTYLGMTMPMAIFSLISWLKNPYNGKRSEVKIDQISKKEAVFMGSAAVVVSGIFFFILAYFRTANLLISTLSVSTSFVAVYLTFRRNSYFAVGYAANDLVLIVLWTLASLENSRYVSVVVCFIAFLWNDLYGFVSWQKMKKRQKLTDKTASAEMIVTDKKDQCQYRLEA